MNRYAVAASLVGIIALSVGLSPESAAAEAVRPERATITVFPDRLVLNSRIYQDMRAIDKQINAMGTRAVTLQACGPRASRAMMVTVYQFRHFAEYIVGLDGDDPRCSPMVFMPASIDERGLTAVDDSAVDIFWRSLVP